jgi:lactoylglutathione lyase
MPIVTWDHVHLRSPDPEATAAWLEDILGGVIIRGPGRIDVKLGGANVFIAPVTAGDGVNTPPVTPYQGLDHFGLTVKDIDAVAAEIKAKGVEFKSRRLFGQASASASSGGRRASPSNSWSATKSMREGWRAHNGAAAG